MHKIRVAERPYLAREFRGFNQGAGALTLVACLPGLFAAATPASVLNIACQRFASLEDAEKGRLAKRPASGEEVAEVASKLLSRGPSKPRKLKSLTTSIRALLGQRAAEIEISDVIAQLSDRAVLTVTEGGKVVYTSDLEDADAGEAEQNGKSGPRDLLEVPF